MNVVELKPNESWEKYSKKINPEANYTGMIISHVVFNVFNVSDVKTIHYYLVDGLLHREGAPAIEWSNGACYWYLNNLLHREDGPAICFAHINLRKWFLDGIKLTPEEHFQRLSPEQKEKAIWHINDWK